MMPYALPPAETRLSISALAYGYLGKNDDFGEILSHYLGAGTCVLANSARSLIYLLLCHLSTKGGRDKTEVLIPGYTCYSVPAAIVKAGLKVALYDMDTRTFQPDMKDVAGKINANTLAVIGQHLLGIRSDIEGLAEIAHAHNAVCIEDSAQLLKKPPQNGYQKDKPDYTVFSFGRGKPLPLGSGGALIASNPDNLTSVSSLMKQYRQRDGRSPMPVFVQVFSHPRFYWVLEKLPLGLGRTIYDPTFKVSGMPRMYQRIGSRSIAGVDRLNEHRAAVGNIYRAYLSGKGFPVIGQPNTAYVRYPLQVRNRNAIKRLFKYGVRQLYPLALCDLPALQQILAAPDKIETPGSRAIARNLVTLPTHLSVTRRIAFRLMKEIALNI